MMHLSDIQYFCDSENKNKKVIEKKYSGLQDINHKSEEIFKVNEYVFWMIQMEIQNGYNFKSTIPCCEVKIRCN